MVSPSATKSASNRRRLSSAFNNGIAIGHYAAKFRDGVSDGVVIGNHAGRRFSSDKRQRIHNWVAIGANAANNMEASGVIAIGRNAAANVDATAVGGGSFVAIGTRAGEGATGDPWSGL